MNFEEAKISIDSVKDKEETFKTIKSFLNKINDSLYLLKENGYDTTDAYVVYDLLRYDTLTSEKIEMLYNQGKTTEIIKKFNIFCSLLDSLTQELEQNKTHIDVLNDEINEGNKRVDTIKENIDSLDKKGFEGKAFLLSTFSLLFPSIISGALFNNFHTTPQTIIHELDTSGLESESVQYYDHPENKIYIEEYLPVDDSGHRIKKVYKIGQDDAIVIKNKDDLSNIDLSSLTPESETLIYDEEINNKTNGLYRKIINHEINESEKKVKDISFDDFILILIDVMATHLIFVFLTHYDLIDDSSNYSKYIYNLARYKIVLRKELNKMSKNEKERTKYEKIINTLCSRIDKLILQVTDIIAINDLKENYSTNKDIKKAEAKFKQVSKEKQEKKTKIIDSIEKISELLTDELSKLDYNDEKDVESILHSIPVNESVLFEKKGDHLVIKSMFIPLLNLFDLSLVSFDNVDVRYIDFSKTNAIISVRNVYNMDISFASFSDENILDWSDYSGVNITGTKLEENPSTMINIDQAIDDEKTETMI